MGLAFVLLCGSWTKSFMEFEILQVMRQAAGTLFSDKQICKLMDRQEYRESPHWARPILEKMVFERLIWKEEVRYLFPTEEQENERRRSAGKQNAAQAGGSKPEQPT